MENANRFRISTNFVVPKVVIGFIEILTLGTLIWQIFNQSINASTFIVQVFVMVALAGVYYYISKQKRIDYDDVLQILYIVDTKKGTEIEVPVEKIDKILLSAIGGRGNSSYVIVYRDAMNETEKVRLFPILFDNSINTLKIDSKFKNPDLVIRNWTFGWNELFD